MNDEREANASKNIKSRKKRRQKTPNENLAGNKILEIIVHKCDRLHVDVNIKRPFVRVTIVDQNTGKYLEKANIKIPATSYYENINRPLPYIQPVITPPFDLRQKNSLIPIWQDTILINQDFDHFTKEASPAIIFFEILDTVSCLRASVNKGRLYKIAWGFLKLRSQNGNLNIDSKFRLQLHHYPSSSTVVPEGEAEIYHIYTKSKILYPSTLFVSIKSVNPPETMDLELRSTNPFQKEGTKNNFIKMMTNLKQKYKQEDDNKKIEKMKSEFSTWRRYPNETCKVPNTFLHILSAGVQGCTVVKFSPDGRRLACACILSPDKTSSVKVYDVLFFKLLLDFVAHFNLIHDLAWSPSGSLLASASADTTSKIWHSESGTEVAALPHPSFVYSIIFVSQTPEKYVITGGFDQFIHIWDIEQSNEILSLAKHRGYINSICQSSGNGEIYLYSGDSEGGIIEWRICPKDKRILKFSRFIVNEDLHSNSINSLSISEGNGCNGKIIVHTCDDYIRMIDLRTCSVIQKFIGNTNSREKLNSIISPCTNLLLAGSENGTVVIWNIKTGEILCTLRSANLTRSITHIDYHPHDNMLALCCRDEEFPLQILVYQREVEEDDLEKPSKEKLSSPRPSADNYNLQARQLRRLKEIDKKLSSVTEKNPKDLIEEINTDIEPHMLSPHKLTPNELLLKSSKFGKQRTSITGSVKTILNIRKQGIDFELKNDNIETKTYVTTYSYKGQRSDELSFEKGQKVKIIHKDTKVWWLGRLEDGSEGYFPSSCISE